MKSDSEKLVKQLVSGKLVKQFLIKHEIWIIGFNSCNLRFFITICWFY